MTPDSNRIFHLFDAHSRGTITPEEHGELQEALRNNPSARQLWFLHQDIEAGLQDLFQSNPDIRDIPIESPKIPVRPPAWRPLTAAAAGLILGLLSASVVLGLGVRPADLVVSLLRESFEHGPEPGVTGVPVQPDRWSGDFCEVTCEQQKIRPAEGLNMVRLLRSDYAGRSISRPSRQGDLMRVVDVRHFMHQTEGRDVVLSLSALFNTAAYASAERYDAMVTVYALGPGIDLHTATEDSVKEEALAFSIGECRSLDRDAGTWQAASTQLLLPESTTSVLLKVSFRRGPAPGESLADLPPSIDFSGHFVDDVRASLRIRRSPPPKTEPQP